MNDESGVVNKEDEVANRVTSFRGTFVIGEMNSGGFVRLNADPVGDEDEVLEGSAFLAISAELAAKLHAGSLIVAEFRVVADEGADHE